MLFNLNPGRLERCLIFWALAALFGLIGCTDSAAPAKPTIIILSPPNGSVYSVGEQVVVQSSAADASGITRVELYADGLPVNVASAPVANQTQFPVLQNWTPTTPGSHILTVRAYNTQGVMAETGVAVTVNERAAQVATAAPPIVIPTLVALPTAVPPPTAAESPTATGIPTAMPTPLIPPTFELPTVTVAPTTAIPPTVPTCVLNLQFIADVTIPDGTQMNPGAAFTKTWRVRNNGTCAWDTGYAIAFVSGANLAGFTQNIIPPTAPGATADISIPMTAPLSNGSYVGIWRLRDSSGQFFGTNLSVQIVVGTPTATATNTTIPPTGGAPPSGCVGTPDDFTFTVSPANINAGQTATLSWSAITNASGAFLDGQGIATPGNRNVKPAQTTTYTLQAVCGTNTRTKTVTVNVTGTSAPSFAGHWNVRNQGAEDCTADFTVLGNSLSGTFCRKGLSHTQNGSLQGTISNIGNGISVSGNYSIPGATSGSFSFVIYNSSVDQFRGSFQAFGSPLEFCGWRDGASPPGTCFASP
jgi:hypothetical protein